MSKKKKKLNPKLHKDLEGFSISVNQFGEIKSTFPIDKLNEFLNEQTDDKKIPKKQPDKDEEAE